jgi:hypothetical protein
VACSFGIYDAVCRSSCKPALIHLHRPRALVIQKLSPPLGFLRRLRRRIAAKISANRQPAPYPRPFTQFLKPALKIRKFSMSWSRP